MEQTPNVILNYINSGGVVALLVALLWLGYSGRVVSSKHVESIITQVVREVLKELERIERNDDRNAQ